MRTRRELLGGLGAMGVTGLAGCSGDDQGTESPPGNDPAPGNNTTATDTPEQTQTPEETPEETPTETPEPDWMALPVGQIPVDGLTLYEEALQDVDPRRYRDEISAALEGRDGLYEHADALAAMLDGDISLNDQLPGKVNQLAKAYYQAQEENSELPDMMFNANYGFDGRSGPIAEVYPVNEHGELQEPVLHKMGYTQKPGEGGTLSQFRDSSKAAVFRPQNMESLKKSVENYSDRASDIEVRQELDIVVGKYSWGMFGGNDESLRPLTYEDGEAVYEDEVLSPELQRQYGNSEHAGNGEVTTFEHEGGLEFSFESGETEMGDPLEP